MSNVKLELALRAVRLGLPVFPYENHPPSSSPNVGVVVNGQPCQVDRPALPHWHAVQYTEDCYFLQHIVVYTPRDSGCSHAVWAVPGTLVEAQP